jgi:hypothetical protein
MAGPHSPNPIVGADGPHYAETTSPEPERHEFIATEPAFPTNPAINPATNPPDGAAQSSARYPEQQLPPARAYPRRRPKRLIIGLLVVVALVSAMTAAIVYGVRTNGANTGATFSEGTVKTAIQGYLDALEHRDIETISRNALCGMYDGVRDHRIDEAMAKTSSDAFRKQFSQVTVTSIDKIVYLSQYQAHVLFTMRVSPATGGPTDDEIQGLAKLLFQRGQVSVCSYIPRDAGTY